MTIGNYLGLNQLLTIFPQLVILGFPCAQFFNQEPGHNDEILNCLKYVRPGGGYVPNFLLMEKSLVNGANTSNLYVYLKSQCPQPSQIIGDPQYFDWDPVQMNDITWNFEKFLITKSGKPYRRYTPETFPPAIVDDITYLMAMKS